jgi:hypothetical protein
VPDQRVSNFRLVKLDLKKTNDIEADDIWTDDTFSSLQTLAGEISAKDQDVIPVHFQVAIET